LAYEGLACWIFASSVEKVFDWAAIRNFGRIRLRDLSGGAVFTEEQRTAFLANNRAAVTVSTKGVC
jgi:hypothetical protein